LYKRNDFSFYFFRNIKRMDQTISELIRSGTTGGEGSSFVFYNLHNSSARFSVSQNRLADFFHNYCHIAYEDYRSLDNSSFKPHTMGIAESAINTTIPIMGEFNLKFHLVDEEDDGSGIMGIEFIQLVVHCYQQVISELIDVDESHSEFLCVTLESSPEISGDEASVKLRVQFPYCQVSPDFYQRKIRPRLEQQLRGKNVCSKLRLQPIGDWHSIIQSNKESYPMYCSTSTQIQNKLIKTHIYSLIEEGDLKDPDSVPEQELEDIFKPENHTLVQRGMIPIELINSIKENEDIDFYDFWFPLFLSVSFWGKVAKLREQEASAAVGHVAYDIDVSSDEPKIIARYMLSMLTKHRVIQEFFWLDVGRTLFNINEGSSEGLEMWIDFSRRFPTPERGADNCRSRYETLRDTGLSVKTLAFYAREDNPVAYDEWHTQWILPKLHASLSLTNADVASAVYRMFWLNYYYDSQTDKWWRFYGSSLRKIERAIALRKDINSVLVWKFEEMRNKKFSGTSAGMSDLENREREEMIKQIGKLIQKLKTDSFVSSVLKSCQAVGSADNPASGFDVPDFNRRIDSDPNKTGWSDCVIECCGMEASVRKGKPEDFITKVSPVGYRRDFNWKHPIVLEVQDFFQKVFVDSKLRHHVYKRLASILKGRNGEKLFDILSGGGDNAKSVFVSLIKAVFGPYAVDFPVSMLTGGNKNSGSASPELAQARGAHAAFVSEPDSGDEMKAGPIKRFTGNDSFFCRMLFDNGGSIESFIKLFYMCNRIPNIPNADKAVKNRLWICPFLSTFCKDPESPDNPEGYPLDESEQYRLKKFKANPDFHTRIPDLAYGLLWIMVQYYPQYAMEGLTPVPEIVTQVTEEHWRDNDAYLQFVHEKIEYAYITDPSTGLIQKDEKGFELHDTKQTLSTTGIYPVFNQWWRMYYPGTPIPDLRTLKAELSSKDRLGTQTKSNNWVGVRLKSGSVQVADGGGLSSSYSGGGGGVCGGSASSEDSKFSIPIGVPKTGGLLSGLSNLGLVRPRSPKIGLQI